MERRRLLSVYCVIRSVCCLLLLRCVAVLPLAAAQDSQSPDPTASAASAGATTAAASAANAVSSAALGTTSAPQSSSGANVSWTPNEGLLLSSILASDVVLWGPVTAPPWLAYVSASLPCDKISEGIFFTANRQSYSSSAVSYRPNHFIRKELPLLNTVKGVYTVLGCLTACFQSKNFTCQSFDYFWKDGGRCGLHNFIGQEGNIDANYYSTTNDGADHYDLTVPGNCSTTATPYKSHNFATLGWQAFAMGWTELAIYEFDKAIQTGENSLTSYLGRTLCNAGFGFGGSTGSYKKEVLDTVVSTELTTRMSKQENLYFRALASLLNASNLTDGSAAFAGVINEETGSKVDTAVVDLSQYALGLTLRGVALLNVDLRVGADVLIQRARSRDITAMAYLTKLLDPYNNAPDVHPLFDRAVEAATAFYNAYTIPNGLLCASLARSSVNVLEAYSSWTIASQVAQILSSPAWLAQLVSRQLLLIQQGTYYVKDIGLVFTSRDEQVVLFERIHFQQLQAGQFDQASSIFIGSIAKLASSSNSFERAVAYRAIGTAYYVCAGAVYDSYAANLTFSGNASMDPAKDELSWWSIGYHQLAQYLRSTESASGANTTASFTILEQQLGQYVNATDPSSPYRIGLNMLLSIAKSRELENNGKIQEAVDAAKRGSMLQSSLANASFLLTDVPGSKYFRQLLPLGFIYYGELLKRAYDSNSLQNTTGILSECDTTLLSAVNWLPRNNSRSLLILGTFYSKDLYRPDVALQYLLTLIRAWNSTGTTDKGSAFPGYLNAVAIKIQLESPAPGPCPGTFSVNVGCFGFWIVIAIAIAAVIIITVTVVVLRTRRRIRRPVTDKGPDSDFIFKGPQDLLSPDTNTLSSLYRYGNIGSARSLDSSTHELAESYNQEVVREANGYYKSRAASEAGDSEIPEAPPAAYSNSTFAPTTLERSQPQTKYVRVKRRDAPPPDADAAAVSTAGSTTTLERGFNVPKDFE